MDPTLPDQEALEGMAAETAAKAGALGARLHPDTLTAISALLRMVNCYYSNLIEGHDTHPVDIDRAMRQDYSGDPRRRSLQLEARAHIEVQLLMEEDLVARPDRKICATEYLCWVHGEFYQRLPEELRTVRDPADGRELTVTPGAIRAYDVRVGDHIAPPHGEVAALLDRFSRSYDPAGRAAVPGLLALGAAHHRLLWIHPFGDGNGRVTRLMTDAYLRRIGVGGAGLWTASRGLARRSAAYRDALAAADAMRWNDYDGRGPLSLKALGSFCRFFLETCLDQVTYMGGLLDLEHLTDRVRRYGRAREAGIISGATSGFREEASLLLEHLVYRGSLPRGDVPKLLRLEERTARRVVRLLIEEGFISAPTTRAPIRLRIPAHAAAHLFPGLYQPGPGPHGT
jgi:Fic family protein